MASLVEVFARVTVTDATGLISNRELPVQRFSLGVGNAPVRQEVSLTGGAFTALTVPTGAKLLQILTNGTPSLVLKGVTSDTGIALSPATGALIIDQLLTLGTSPSIGILNNGTTATIECIWY